MALPSSVIPMLLKNYENFEPVYFHGNSFPHEHIFCGEFFIDHFYLLVYLREFARVLCHKYIY